MQFVFSHWRADVRPWLCDILSYSSHWWKMVSSADPWKGAWP